MRDPADDFTAIEAEFLKQAAKLEAVKSSITLEGLGREFERALARRELAEAIALELAAA